MMAEWHEVKVSDLGKIVTGKTPKTSEPSNYGGDVPFLTPSDDLSKKYSYVTGKTLTVKGMNSVKGSLIPADSISVSCIGSDLGKVIITTRDTVTNQQMNSIILNKEKYDVDFVYYSMLALGKIMNFHSKTSTAIPIVNKSAFSEYTIKCPKLSLQQEIGSILATIDAKIEANEQINKNLEEQVQAIYCELSSKLVGEPVSISEIVDVRDGTHDSPKPQQTGFPLITSKHLLPYGVDASSANYISEEDYNQVNERSKVDTGDILLSMIGTVGLISYVIDEPVEFAIKNVGLFKTSKEPKYSLYILEHLKSAEISNHIEKCLAGTTQKYISLGELRKLPIRIPSDTQIEMFSKTVSPLIEQIANNVNENVRLTALRDTILPKLMSGEIDVSEITI